MSSSDALTEGGTLVQDGAMPMIVGGAPRGVLLLAYGAPRSIAEVEPFLERVTGGRQLSPTVVEESLERYRRIGGISPLPAILDELAAALGRNLCSNGGRFHVTLGTLHSSPSILQAVEALAEIGVADAVAIPLVPQYSAATVGRYLDQLDLALRTAGAPFTVTAIRSWATHPLLIEAFAERVRDGLEGLSSDRGDDGRGQAPALRTAGAWAGEVRVLFTAHSVPVAAIADGDPFEEEIKATASAIATRVGVAEWEIAYQSAARGGGPWLGPTVEQAVADFARSGGRRMLVVPLHFLADNVEVLCDLDVSLRDHAERLGVHLARSESLNASPLLVAALADLAQNPTQTQLLGG